MNFEFRPQTQPQGAYGHQSSLSEPSWGSEQDHAQGEDYSAKHSWTFSTPPPDSTQEDTQYREDGSVIPPRNVLPPHRYLHRTMMYSSPWTMTCSFASTVQYSSPWKMKNSYPFCLA
ncbi:uncharacterized protein LOC112271835 [Brachypodium distachyon]|uniref:uncharacterized protein LOC112271835 n=1 Tax=Brachypodium distachyon TaxID=15368 RepID=UPI000D0E1EBD|nr:uncharacterized protein LOC112271835 [Brachypodium distachyon]|eukprot:XP_024317791.1 uncharacterized protein LOC112271835 [Brachypodium distachyon]